MAGFWSMFNTTAANGPTNITGGQQSTGPRFPNGGSQNQQTSQQNEPGNRPTNGATLPNDGSGNQGNGNGQNSNQQQPSNPLDTYSKMFENKPTEGDAPPSFTLDPKQLDGIVGGLDFTKGIDPAVIQRATQGDANALMEMMQGVSRNSYRAAIEHGGVLTDKFVGARESYQGKKFPTRVREELVTNQLASNTPNFQHPVVRQQLTEIARRFQGQHPDATAAEIGEMSKKYLQDLMDAIRPPEDKQQANQQKPEMRDEAFWDDYFSENSDQQT